MAACGVMAASNKMASWRNGAVAWRRHGGVISWRGVMGSVMK